MSTRLHIALDFDDTLLPMRERVAELLSADFGMPAGPFRDDSFRISQRWGLSKEQFLLWFAGHQRELHEIEPFPGVRETLRAWSGFAALRVITGRRADVIEHAARWVRRHDLPISEIHSAPSAREKAACALANGVSWFVDDDADTACAVADAGISAILLEKDYNLSCVDLRVRHAGNWQEIAAMIDCQVAHPMTRILS